MKKRIISLLMFIFAIFALSSCGEVQETPNVPNVDLGDGENTGNNNGNQGDTSIDPDDSVISGEVEYSVSLIFNKKVYTPKDGEEIKVIWQDDYAQYSQVIASDGYAKIKLDGEFNIYLKSCPSGYTYNPNIYTASNDSPNVEIELLKIAKIRGGGVLRDEIEISSTGTYRATLNSASKKIFYSFEPKESGYYIIESIVNVYDDMINPSIDTYNGNAGGTRYYDKTISSGGAYKKGGYTKNFQWVVNLADDQTAGVFFVFCIYADSKTGVYPIDVDFTVTYSKDYYRDDPVGKIMVAEEANFKTPNFSATQYVYRNSDHGLGSYYNAQTNGTGLLKASDYKYNEETGYWHLYKNGEFGPILCAAIGTPCAYYEESLNMIESHGNKNLTVSNGTENYKTFIEVEYTAASNSSGYCYVTNELKEFLQKFSVSQRLFFDGNGFVESTGVYAIEEDQWLFACGYYEER